MIGSADPAIEVVSDAGRKVAYPQVVGAAAARRGRCIDQPIACDGERVGELRRLHGSGDEGRGYGAGSSGVATVDPVIGLASSKVKPGRIQRDRVVRMTTDRIERTGLSCRIEPDGVGDAIGVKKVAVRALQKVRHAHFCRALQKYGLSRRLVDAVHRHGADVNRRNLSQVVFEDNAAAVGTKLRVFVTTAVGLSMGQFREVSEAGRRHRRDKEIPCRSTRLRRLNVVIGHYDHDLSVGAEVIVHRAGQAGRRNVRYGARIKICHPRAHATKSIRVVGVPNQSSSNRDSLQDRPRCCGGDAERCAGG